MAADDISLFLSGDRAKPYRERGITTVQALIDADLGEPSRLASAWRAGEVLLRRGDVHVPRADVEVDVDMEAYLDGARTYGEPGTTATMSHLLRGIRWAGAPRQRTLRRSGAG